MFPFQLMLCLWENHFVGFYLQKCLTNTCESVFLLKLQVSNLQVCQGNSNLIQRHI